MFVALPIVIWSVTTQKFLFDKHAASGEPVFTPYPTPTIDPSATDDIYFISNTNQSLSFTTTDQNPNISIDPNNLVNGKTYVLNINYSLQNDLKSQTASTSGIPVIILVDNVFKSAKEIPYSLIANHRDGASDTQSLSFTAQGNSTKIEVIFDPNDIFHETNETNNNVQFVFDRNHASPSPSPIAGDVNGDGLVNIVDVGIIIDNYRTSPPGDVRADLNHDNIINIVDIGIVTDNYQF